MIISGNYKYFVYFVLKFKAVCNKCLYNKNKRKIMLLARKHY